MKPRSLNFILLSSLLILWLSSGCTLFKPSSDLKASMPKIEGDRDQIPADRHLAPDKAAARVEASLQKAESLVKSKKYEEARVEYDKALRILLLNVDPNLTGEWKARIDQLFLMTNLAMVRLARLRGVMLATETQPASEMGIGFNAQIERWLTYYLTDGRGSMKKYLQRMGPYNQMIEQVLREKNMPGELKYLPIIESGYSPYAYSPAAAAGLWQFIPGTGRRFGLTINDWVDERRDPEKSTRAASEYLSFLYGMFNDWALALAAYNCGEERVAGAIRSTGTKDYWQLSLPNETVNYVPKYYAAMMIAREPEIYGFYVEPDPPTPVEKLRLEGPVDLRKFSELIALDYTELKDLNPEILGNITPPNVPAYNLRIPANRAEVIRAALADVSAEELYLSPDEVEKVAQPRSVGNGKTISYKVKKGDTLGGIARRYKTTVNAIKRLNRIKGNVLKPGTKLRIQPGAK